MAEIAAVPDNVDAAVLVWAEQCGIENLKGRAETAGRLAKEGATTLTVLLAGVGGSLAYAAKLLEPNAGPMAAAAAVMCAYLALLCVVLVVKCMLLRAFPAIYNEPLHLAQPGYELHTMRRVELANIAARIKQAMNHNDRTARWLNGVRLCAAASPLVFLAAVGIWAGVS
jgi:hypothetical protein